jgi:c-di-GMP-binding flagellar brake protein YcgR
MLKPTNNFIERREYFRITIDCEITYRYLDDEEFRQARCNSLSGGGLAFITGHELQPEEEVEVIIQSQLPGAPPMRAHAKVVRVQPLDAQTFEVAASMTVIHDDDYLSL